MAPALPKPARRWSGSSGGWTTVPEAACVQPPPRSFMKPSAVYLPLFVHLRHHEDYWQSFALEGVFFFSLLFVIVLCCSVV